MMRYWPLAPLALLSGGALAQPAPDPATIWTIQDENAALAPTVPRDHMYTNGVRLGWTGPTGDVPEGLAAAAQWLLGDGQRRLSFDAAQQMYTPMLVHQPVPNPKDRPYAGVLLGSLSLVSDTPDTRTTLTTSAGVVGPPAGAGQTQNAWHTLIGSTTTQGWSYQVPTTPAVEYSADRTWRVALGHGGGIEADALPSLTAGLGTVRDYAQVGLTVRLGQGLTADYGAPRLRPGLSGGDAYTPTRPFAWYVYAGADAQAVAYDITLQSAPFRSGPAVTALPAVAELQAGVVIMVSGARLTIGYVAQTAEFVHQSGGLHQFVSASLGWRF